MPKSGQPITICPAHSPSFSQPIPLIFMIMSPSPVSNHHSGSHPYRFYTTTHLTIASLFSSFLQPVTNNNPWMLLYFISFLLIVSFFVLNMFVGVVVENFHKCRQHQEAEEARRREEKRLRRLEKKRRSKAQPKCLVGS